MRSPRLLVQLPSVTIQGSLLEQCPVAMTFIPLFVTNGDFLFTIRIWDSSRFVIIQFWDCCISSTYKFGTDLILVLYKFGLEF